MSSSSNNRRSGKAIDRSTEWSDWGWDEAQSRWYRHRYDQNGQSEYDYPDIAETTSQETPRSVVGSDAIPAYSTAPTTDSRYYENDGYTVDDMTQKLSSSTVTPVTYVTNSTESRHSPYGHGNLYQNASAPAGGYMGNHPGSASSVTSDARETGAPIPKVHKNISGTAGEVQPLDPNYKIYDSTYFKPCHVFQILWSEPEGVNRTDNTEVTGGNWVRPTKHGEKVYTSIRRFVIVAADHGHCQCVPILTYNHRGTAKNGAQSSEHAIIYTGSKPPKEVKGEAPLKNEPIEVVPNNPRNKLAVESRVNYAKIYTVEHNVKVCFIGRIAASSRRRFMTDFDAAWNRKWKASGY